MTSFLSLFLSIFVAFAAESPEAAPTAPAEAAVPATGKQITGIVRLIRAHPETEVFFIDGKESAIIHKDSKHNKIFEACEESRKKKQPISLVVDPISRRVVGVAEKKSEALVESSPQKPGPLGTEKSDSGSQ